MQELSAKIAELRGQLESFTTGVGARLTPLRGGVDSLSGKLQETL